MIVELVEVRPLIKANESERKILLSVDVEPETTYGDVYKALETEWQEEGTAPITGRTTDEEMDKMFLQGLSRLRKENDSKLQSPFHTCIRDWPRTRNAFFEVTWKTNEDHWDRNKFGVDDDEF